MILGDGILSILAADIIIWPIDSPVILLLKDAGLKYAILNSGVINLDSLNR